MATYSWKHKVRNYGQEKEKLQLESEETSNHPLKPLVVSEVKKIVRDSNKKDTGKAKPAPSVDPLSSALDGSDPLSMFAAAAAAAKPSARARDPLSGSDEVDSDMIDDSDMDESFEPWSSRRANILAVYTTSEKLSITTSFLSPADREKVVVKTQVAQNTVTDQVKNRLEQLDDFEEGSIKEMLNLSQQEYVARIEELNNALVTAWEHDQKVKALKIAIQCAKLLVDTSVIQFYPSKFVLITDILDTFGKLVFDRIRQKSTYLPLGSNKPQTLPENFTPDQVPDSAKETCRNWFFKIASIRELIPRLYVEAAILKCYSFLTTSEYSQALNRLTNQIRGIGDPLVAIYGRAYLSRVGMAVAPQVKSHHINNLYDFINSFSQLESDTVQNILAMQRLDMPSYLHLYSPALDWILQCIAYKAAENTLTEILGKCKKHCNNALLLNSIMSAFKPEFISRRAMEFLELIRDCEEAGYPKHNLYKSLGTNLILAAPAEQHRRSILNEVWKAVMKFQTPMEYITCAEVWVEFPCKHFSKKEVNTILNDIIKHMTPDRAFENHYPELQSVVSKILAQMHDFSILFSMDKFLPFIDMFQKDSVKVDVCKQIMEAFCRYQVESTHDPIIINAAMFICKVMHDSIDALTLDDERRVIGHLISGFVRKISFGRDFEQQLSFYVEARGSFSNLDSVLVTLVQCVNQLASETRSVMKGNHSRKTAAFVRYIMSNKAIEAEYKNAEDRHPQSPIRDIKCATLNKSQANEACAAYSFITVPSIGGIFERLKLYLISGQVALLNQALSQADAFFKATISLITDVPSMITIDNKTRSSEPFLIGFLNQFLATLLLVPDNPDQGVLYLLRGLLNVLQDYMWDGNTDARARVYISVLSLLSAMSQESYNHHIYKVDSNDALYGSDPKFIAEINNTSQTLIKQILDYCKSLPQTDPGNKRQASLAIELFHTIVVHGDIRDESMATLALNLWNLAQKNGQGDTKLMARILNYVKTEGKGFGGKPYADLASKMHLQTRA